MLTGIIAALPAMIVGNIWARYAGKKIVFIEAEEEIITRSCYKTTLSYTGFFAGSYSNNFNCIKIIFINRKTVMQDG